jgi:hypothetical protein
MDAHCPALQKAPLPMHYIIEQSINNASKIMVNPLHFSKVNYNLISGKYSNEKQHIGNDKTGDQLQ